MDNGCGIEFNSDPLIEDIVDRVLDNVPETDVMVLTMDLMAANGVNGNLALDLVSLLATDDANFVHDIAGIQSHMDRGTGRIGGCFVPRFALAATD